MLFTVSCVVYIRCQVLLFFFVLIRSCDLVFLILSTVMFLIAFQFYCDFMCIVLFYYYYYYRFLACTVCV